MYTSTTNTKKVWVQNSVKLRTSTRQGERLRHYVLVYCRLQCVSTGTGLCVLQANATHKCGDLSPTAVGYQ